MNPRCRLLFASLLLAVGVLAVASAPAGARDNYDVPSLTCVDGSATQASITLNVCAGLSGAPAGVSLEWAVFDGVHYAHQDYAAICDLSLSGRCVVGNWSLGSNECQLLTIHSTTVEEQNANGCGASSSGPNCGELLCDTQYIFWVKAHGDNTAGGTQFNDYTGTVCRTAPCRPVGECTLTWGYWKTHGPAGCNPSGGVDKWNVTELSIGGDIVSADHLCAILQTAPSACGKNTGANATLILEHQLIAALLNKANGAIDCGFEDAAIDQANDLLSGIADVGNCTGASGTNGQLMIQVAGTLAAYNSDLCAGHCPTSVIPVADPEAARTLGATPAKPSTWGHLKLIYR